MLKNSNRGTIQTARKKGSQLKLKMVPLFSLKTIIAVVLGLIVGAGLGIGFFVISPNLSSSDSEVEAGGLGRALVPEPTGPWQSTISVQIVNPGSISMSIGQLENMGRLYRVKLNSHPFLEFLSQQLVEQVPEYSHTADELQEMISVMYDSDNPDPTLLIKTTAFSIDEAIFLAGYVPEAFKSYLISEESERQKQEYDNTLKEIEVVKKAILEAEQELRVLRPQGATSGNSSMEPIRIALSARIQALERELDDKAVELADMVAEGNASTDNRTQHDEYQETLQEAHQVSLALSKAEQELMVIEMENPPVDINNEPAYIVLNAKIRALESELNRLMVGDVDTMGLAEMIASGISTGADYSTASRRVKAASEALAEARKELAIFESQSGSDLPVFDLDYQVARAKVDNLNMQLSAIKERLTVLSLEGVDKQDWQEAQTAFERISQALSEARTELAILESLEGDKRLELDLDYQIVQTKLKNLNGELASLGEVLSSSFGGTTDALEAVDFLAVKNPTTPLPVLPDRMRFRDALMMGAVVGIGGAWVILNFRWLIKGASSSFDEEEEEE